MMFMCYITDQPISIIIHTYSYTHAYFHAYLFLFLIRIISFFKKIQYFVLLELSFSNFKS